MGSLAGLGVGCGGTTAVTGSPGTTQTAASSDTLPATITPRVLAKQVHDAMAPLTSVKISNQGTYPQGSPCRRGADHFIVSKTADGSRGWVDIGANGTIDAVRSGDHVYVSSALVPGWGVQTGWIAMPSDKKDQVSLLASRTGPSASAAGPLLDTTPFSDVLLQAEVIAPTGNRTGGETIGGTPTTRFDFTDAKVTGGGQGAAFSAWVDGGNILRRLSATLPGQDPRGLVTVTGELTGTNEPVDVSIPSPSDTTAFADLPAGPIAMDNVYLNPDCETDASAIAAQRACVVAAASTKRVADYARETLANPFGCTTPAGTTPK